MEKKALVAATLVFALSLQAGADAGISLPPTPGAHAPPKQSGPNLCMRTFATIKDRAITLADRVTPARINEKLYNDIRERHVKDYFTESTANAREFSVPGNLVTAAEKAKFQKDFDDLLTQRNLLFNLDSKEFRKWLKAHNPEGQPYPDINRVFLDQKAAGTSAHTMESLQNAYLVARAIDLQGNNLEEFLKKLHPKELASITWTLSKGFAKSTAGYVRHAVFLASALGIVGGAIGVVLAPFIQSTEQLSNIFLASTAQFVAKYSSLFVDLVKDVTGNDNRGEIKKELAELEEATKELETTSFDGLSRDEEKDIMRKFEERYFAIFMRMNGAMPSLKRSGRDIMRDWLISVPVNLATSASVFNLEYVTNRALFLELKNRVAARDGAATSEERRLIEEYQENMETAEKRLAVALASWKIYRFAFVEVGRGQSGSKNDELKREVSNDPKVKGASNVLSDTLGRYEKYMNMGKYREGMAMQIREAFKNFDPTFAGLDQLEFSGKPPAPQLPRTQKAEVE